MTATLLDMTTDLWPDHWGITPSEKAVLEQLGKRADEETDDCFVGLKYIMRRSGLSEDTVRRCIKSLRDKGWLSIKPQERGNGATSANRYLLNFNKIVNAHIAQRDIERDERAARFPGKPEGPPHGATLPRMVRGAPPHGAGGMLPDSQSTNTHSAQARDEFDSAVLDAAGEAADPTSPGIIATYPLWVLLSGDKPCTVEEVVEGVKKAAAWYAKRNLTGKMRNWDTAVQMACEFRDGRINGHPVKECAKPSGATGFGDPATFDHDRWRVLITRVLPKTGGEWPGSLGPPPGAEGSLVPSDLVELWKGEGV